MTDFIWTNHALQRLKDRKISEGQAIEAINNSDHVKQNEDGTLDHRKRFGNQTVSAILKTNELGESIILSCWIDPPNPGSKDSKKESYHKKMRNASFLQKFWLNFLNQIGL